MASALPGGPFYDPELKRSKITWGLQLKRKRLNVVALCGSIFAPWILFCLVSGIWIVDVAYKERNQMLVIALCFLLVCVIFGAKAIQTWMAGKQGDEEWYPAWYLFLFFSTLLAWIVGFRWGQYNFLTNLRPFHDLENLNSYANADVNLDVGETLMDAGTIFFKPGTHIDFSHSMSFKNKRTFCVAPLILGFQQPESYDFWVAGSDCCEGGAGPGTGKFQCGQYDNPKARAGLRVMEDLDRSFYRLAVEQATSKYRIRAKHPLFFYWMEDPVGGAGIGFEEGDGSPGDKTAGTAAAISGTPSQVTNFKWNLSGAGGGINAYKEVGFRNYLLGMLVFFFVNLALVGLAILLFLWGGVF